MAGVRGFLQLGWSSLLWWVEIFLRRGEGPKEAAGEQSG